MKKYKNWGKLAAVNLFDCDLLLLSDPKVIKKFFAELVPNIRMVAHGPVYIDRFGYGNLEGYSAMQFIETSSITVHCDEPGRRVFIDVFSCKNFNVKKVVSFSKNYWKAKKSTHKTIYR